jgi:uncharacterized membrane protein
MTKPIAFLPSATASWSKDELYKLKAMALVGTPIEAIAKALKRSPSSIRNKAGLHGISLSSARSSNRPSNVAASGAAQ